MKYSAKTALFLLMVTAIAGWPIWPAGTTAAAVAPSISSLRVVTSFGGSGGGGGGGVAIPIVASLSPSQGPVGRIVKIYSPLANPFTPTGNTITFYSTSSGVFMSDSKPNASLQGISGNKYLLYTIPDKLIGAGTSTPVVPGGYYFIVSNSNGVSSPKFFYVNSAPIITSYSSVIETSAGTDPAIKLILRGNNFAPTNNLYFYNTFNSGGSLFYAWDMKIVSPNSDGSLFYVIPPLLNSFGTSTIATPTGTYMFTISNGNGSSSYSGINIINFPT